MECQPLISFLFYCLTACFHKFIFPNVLVIIWKSQLHFANLSLRLYPQLSKCCVLPSSTIDEYIDGQVEHLVFTRHLP